MKKKYRNLVVATDLSSASFVALRKAFALAHQLGSKITILHVQKNSKSPSSWWDTLTGKKKRQEVNSQSQVEKDIKCRIDKLIKHNISYKIKVLKAKDPVKKIITYVKSNKVDLLIIGTHRLATIRDWFVATTAEYLAKKITCPVLIVKVKHHSQYKSVLIPIDFSMASSASIDTATNLFPQAHFHVLNIADRAFEDLIKSDYVHTYGKGKQLKKELLQLLLEKTKRYISTLKIKTKNPIRSNVKMGIPGLIIVREAKKATHSLVIIGTQGHSERHYNWLGSVANFVIPNINKDILLVPRDRKKKQVQAKNLRTDIYPS